MEDATILEMVKYVGFALTALSALWGLTQRTTLDDDAGNRRLTPAGQLAALLFIGSAMLSATAFGFESVIKAADADRIAAANKSVAEARARSEALDFQRELTRRAEAAESRATAADQRALTLVLETGQRLRDLELARRVSQGSAATLARAGTILGQTQRLLEPLGEVRIEVRLKVTVPPSDSPGLQRLQQLALAARNNFTLLEEAKVNPRIVVVGRPLEMLEVGSSSPYFPAAEDPLVQAIEYGRLDFDVVAKGSPAEAMTRKNLAAGYSPLSGDLSFPTGVGELKHFTIVFPDSVEFTIEQPVLAADIVRTGKVAAVPDLPDASLILTWTEAFRGTQPTGYAVSVESVLLVVAGRTYALAGDAFRRLESPPLHTHFILPRIGQPLVGNLGF